MKRPSDILKIKKEQAEKQQMSKFTIKSTDKAALKEYDLKSTLYQSMHENKFFNRNPANNRLYHALIEAMIKDKNVMDKRVSDTETVEEPIAEVVMDDAGDDVARDDNQPQDTSKPKTRKTLNLDWFKQPPRPPTPDPEWNMRHVVLDQPEQPWLNKMVSTIKDPLTFNDLMATPIDFSKYVLNGLKIENLTRDILLGPAFNMLTYTLVWNNPEGYRYPFDLSKHLPLQGPPGYRTIVADYFFNNDLEYLKTSDPEVTYTTSIMKTKAARYEIKGIEDIAPTLWSTIKHAYDKDEILGVKSVSVKKLHGYGHLEEIMVKRSDQQLYKFKEGDFVDLHLNNIEDMLLLAVQHKLFHLDQANPLTI
ncbi:hypothetical protein Tco_0370176 [Tanacetum coccineum]